MRILLTTELDDDLLSRISEAAPGAELVVGTESEDWDREYPLVDVVFGRGATPERIRGAARLRWIQVWSAGVDRYMFPELVDSDIVLTNASGIHANTIADHVFMFMLILSRNFLQYYAEQSQKNWNRGLGASELARTTLAVVGLGGIGSEIARRGKAFGQRVLGVRRHRAPHPAVDEVFTVDSLPDVLAQSDFVALACPLTDETRGLMGPREFAAMRPGSYLVNIARGAVVEEAAMVESLRSGHLGGVGLDVFEHEPLPEDSPLWKMHNVIITPHMAGSQRSYMAHAIEIFVANLERFRKGRQLLNQVDKSLGY